jgi:hypothetical protein
MLKHLITLLFLIPTLFAETTSQVSIDEQITAIKSATPSERVVLMNAFKVRVSQMNQQERSTVIAEMQAKINPQTDTKNTETLTQIQLQEGVTISHYKNISSTQVSNQISRSNTEVTMGRNPNGNTVTQHQHK